MFTLVATKNISAKLFALCLTTLIAGSAITAQAASDPVRNLKADAVTAVPVVSADDVTVSVLDTDESANLDKTAGITGSDLFWAHGNSGVLESGSIYTVKTYGWGAALTSPATNSAKFCWLHYSVPTPVKIANTAGKLKRIFIAANVGGTITSLDVYDGATKILSKPLQIPDGNYTNAPIVVEFATPVTMKQALGLSIHVGGCLLSDQGCLAATTTVTAVGAEFIR